DSTSTVISTLSLHDALPISKYRDQFKQPAKLSEVIEEKLGDGSDYIAVFIPGGHGALIGLPESDDMKAVLEWAAAKDKLVISLRSEEHTSELQSRSDLVCRL